jgi:hypothetical protein
MFCTEERKEEFVVVTERERDRNRDAKEAQQRPPTNPVSENRLPFPPFRPCPPPKKNPCPENSPSPPQRKKQKLKVSPQVMRKYFIKNLISFFQKQIPIFVLRG